MIYRLAAKEDLPRLMEMVEQAKKGFKAKGIDQWQNGYPDEEGVSQSILLGQVYVLDENGQAVAMLTIVPGPEESYAVLEGKWLNEEPYYAFHRVCVEETMKGHGLAARLFLASEDYVRSLGCKNVRIDTHPDNLSMQRALAKSGYTFCGTLHLIGGADDGAVRIGYHKVLD